MFGELYNLQQPAFPNPWKGQKKEGSDDEVAVITHLQPGFTKLEYAALMIAQGVCASYKDAGEDFLVSKSIRIAARILEKCNK